MNKVAVLRAQEQELGGIESRQAHRTSYLINQNIPGQHLSTEHHNRELHETGL